MILAKSHLEEALSKLSEQAIVYVPKEVSGVLKFAPFVSGDEMRLDVVSTTLPPKDMLFPQCQNMYHYGVDARDEMFVDPIIESADQIIFGIRSCDMRSIECLDDVFFTKGYIDEFYQAKRDKLTTIAIGCTSPAETCFCDSVGVDPTSASSADVQLQDLGDSYSVVANTEKGQAIVESLSSFIEEGDAGQPTAVECSLKVNSNGIKDRIAALAEDDAFWERMGIKCLNCGTCTYLCPTCYCFDIEQENRFKEGVRFRCWDSCMFSEYTEMAGGHNPRPSKTDRVRNRFMHKLSYFEDRYGKMLCVGCGRCVEKCPVALDITVLIDKVGEVSDE